MKQAFASFLERYPQAKTYIAVTRFDKPIGIYLLLWPTLIGLWFAAEGWPGWHLFLVFALGTVLTRSAGCVANDLADREFDGSVQRTEQRPLATGELEPLEAMLLAGVILFFALLLVLTTNVFTVGLAAVAVVIAVIYPFKTVYIKCYFVKRLLFFVEFIQ